LKIVTGDYMKLSLSYIHKQHDDLHETPKEREETAALLKTKTKEDLADMIRSTDKCRA
jgi:hypothetical protein